MYVLFEKSSRGGISHIFNRYSKANNKYLKSYDPKEEPKHITYLGVNNLHGYAMARFLPRDGFKWIDPTQFDLNKYTRKSSKGCVLEVDLEYPKELRELHNECPLAPDKMSIQSEMLSEYQLKITDLCFSTFSLQIFFLLLFFVFLSKQQCSRKTSSGSWSSSKIANLLNFWWNFITNVVTMYFFKT